MESLSREQIFTEVCAVIEEMVADWEVMLTEPLAESSRIVADLGFESVDLMQLMVAVEQRFGARHLPFEELLLEDGAYVSEVTLGQLVDFLQRAGVGP